MLPFEVVLIFVTYFRIIRRVVLDDPVYSRDVKASRRDISTDEYGLFGATELIERLRPFRLLLFPLESHHHKFILVNDTAYTTNSKWRNEKSYPKTKMFNIELLKTWEN